MPSNAYVEREPIKAASFDVKTRTESHLIRKIVDRAMAMGGSVGRGMDRLEVEMDITAAHCNGCELKLHELLQADDFNFSHDVFGIQRHINRTTGKLEDHFLPRFAFKN